MTEATILVVEDEVIVARTIVNQLNQLGYTIAGRASSGEVAIAKAIETRPNLVLMDIVLKGTMDGVAAAAYIRERLDIPVVYLTAYADAATIQRAKITQPFGYIVKPFTANDLRVSVEIGLFKHQLEQELRANRHQLATLLHSMSDAVISTSVDGRITFMNPAAERLTGWPQQEALGMEFNEIFQIVDEVTDLPNESPVTRVLQNEEVVYLDPFTALIHRNGSRIPIGDSASPLRGQDGAISGVVVVFWDISDRRQTELLTQALAKEREVNQLKSQFVSTVSHEFRNPLAVIRTAIALLETQADNRAEVKYLDYLQRIKVSVQSMNTLMEDVLVIGQAEVARLPCQPTELNLEEFCREIIAELSIVETRQHPIVFTWQNNDCTHVQLDEKLLRYILTNLLSNAVKYSPISSPVYFEVDCNLAARVVTFQIRDQGIGIPEADQIHLFDPFYRASNVGSIQGTGLGLAIAKRCVDAHQGQIQVHSIVQHGTTFTVTLPLPPAALSL